MNVTECLKTRRSIRKYKADKVDHSVIDSIVSGFLYPFVEKYSDHPLYRYRRSFSSK